MFLDSNIFKKFLECIYSKISLTCSTETDAVYQNVLDSERRMTNLTFCLILRLVQETIAAMRDDIETEFAAIYTSAVAVAERLQVTVSKPRIAARSVYRSNAGTTDQSVDEYYRINMFVPLLDGYLTHINERFGLVQQKCLSLSRLVPAFLGTYEDIKESVVMYSSFVAGPLQVEGEFALWRQQWINKKVTTAAAAVECCSPIIMPNIRQLLLILAMLPVTTAEAERVFSKVERTATAARAHMTEDRLEALVMINTHRRLTPDFDSVITCFAESGARRINFVI